MLGWIGKGADVSLGPASMKLSGNRGQPFLTNSNLNFEGPLKVSMRIRSGKDGKGKLQWRTKDQKDFTAKGQSRDFSIEAEDWMELSVPLPVNGFLRHLRIFMPAGKEPLEIGWIEIRPSKGKYKRWNFGVATKTNQKTKPQP